MIKIRIFSSYCSSSTLKDSFERVFNSNIYEFYGTEKKYIFTDNNDYTHAIIINNTTPSLKIDKKNVIGFAYEPLPFLGLTKEFINYAKRNICKYYVGDKLNLPDPFIEGYSYMLYLSPPKEILLKTKLMSIIVSGKKNAPGHKYRHILVENIIKFKLPIDIYGRGSNNYKYEGRIMGNFNDEEPYKDYLFSICIENYKSNHYFSEKVINSCMFNAMPIYYGCKNIHLYLDNVIIIYGDLKRDLNIILDIIRTPSKYYKKTYIEKNLKNINLIENLDSLLK